MNDTTRINPRLPRLVGWLLEHLSAPHVREELVGDIEESLASRAGESAVRNALWLTREVLCAPLTRLHQPRPRTFASSTGDSVMTSLQSDVQFAWRMLVRRPAFTALAVFTLALGIGATTAIFSAVNPILFESLPYPNSDRIAMIWEGRDASDPSNVGYSTFADIAEQNRSFAAVAAVGTATGTLTGRGEPQFLVGQRVTPSFFHVFGVRPAVGRAFSDAENVRGSERVVVLSHALWRNRFAGDSAIVGRTVTMLENEYRVLGVMPASFENVLGPTTQFYIPLRYDRTLPQACRSCRHLRAVALRKADVSETQAQRDLDNLAQRMGREFPTDYISASLRAANLSDDITRGVRSALLAVLGAVALVLLVACLNVMNLLLARAAQRQGEFAVRAALGAGRARIVRQLLVESVLLALVGGAVGVAVAFVGVRILVALSPANLPRLSAIQIEGRVLAFAFAITSVVGIVFGLVPALHAARRNVHGTIRSAARTSAGSARLTRSSLVISEVALAIVLLVGSGLLFRSMDRLFSVNPGFESRNLLTLQIQSGAGRLSNDTLVAQFLEQSLANVRNLPGVQLAALTSQLPLSDDYDQYGVHFESQPKTNPQTDGGGFRYAVSDRYFETMSIPLIAGRYFTSADRAGVPNVVIINQSLARSRFGDASAIGQRLKLGGMNGPWREVIGVVGDVKQTSLASSDVQAVYVPQTQWQFTDYAMTLVVRSEQSVSTLAPMLRQTVWNVDKDQPIIRIATADDLMRERAAERHFALVLFESFAFVALVLAAAGIYGVLAGTVAERNRELGVRAALGATGRDQVMMVLCQGMRLTGIGILVGLGAALASSRILSTLLYDISPVDPVTYLSVTVALVAVSLLACWVPAFRASRTSPMDALRGE